MCRSILFFTSIVHMTPDDTMRVSDDVSYPRPARAAASRASAIGLAKASPTMTAMFARSRSVTRS
ncbi:MAG: hypothetical protein RJA47_517, partial [Actinomycetota bacterium]